MKGFAKLVSMLAIAALCFVACGDDDDEDSSVLSFDVPALYLPGPGAEATVSFTAVGMDRLTITDKPVGWEDVELNATNHTVKIKVPQNLKIETMEEDKTPVEPVASGTIILQGTSYLGKIKSANIFVGVVASKDMSDKPANSYIVNDRNTHYTFATVKGDGTKINPKKVAPIWQTDTKLLQYICLDGDKVSFYTNVDGDQLKEGNALLGAYDEEDNLIWSWHIWVTNYNPESDVLAYQNGYEMMGRNLGALNNANTTPAERLASYGLYYQWGRKDPFIGPNAYQANGGHEGAIYGENTNRVYTKLEETTVENGTRAFADAHPLTFLVGTKESSYDWLWTKDDQAWGERKGVNDPCPYGWKVAPRAAFDGLEIENAPKAEDYDVFGLNLTDGTLTSLYMAGGRRVYNSGRFMNVYNPLPSRANSAMEAQPWEGLYWTSNGLSDRKSASFYFWFEKKTTTTGLRNGVPHHRANGLTLRCVKDR